VHMKWGEIVSSDDLSLLPPWAKHILQSVINLSGKTIAASVGSEEASRLNRRGYLRGFANRAAEGFEAFP